MSGGVRPDGGSGPVRGNGNDAAVGLTSGIEAHRGRLAASILLVFALGLAGLLMPTSAPDTRQAMAGAAPQTSTTRPTTSPSPTASTTAVSTSSSPSSTSTLPPLSPFTTPGIGSSLPAASAGAAAAPPATTTPTTRTTTSTATTAPTVTPALPAVPLPTPPQEACGPTLRKPGGGYWRCSFDDEFNGTSVDQTKWRIQETSWNGFHSGPECFMDRPGNVAVSGGALQLTARREAHGFTCHAPNNPYGTQFTSGMLTTYGKFAQAFGRFEIRAKMPAAKIKGLQTSFWLWPVDPFRYGLYPASGEIDMAEEFSLHPDRVIPYIHYYSTLDQVTNNYCLVPNVADFHNYTLEWTPDAITILFDGVVCLRDEWNTLGMQRPKPFDQPFMLSLTQALGIEGNAFDGSTPLPATTTVDYVRIWK